MKKVISLLLMIALVLATMSLATACNSGSSDTGSTTAADAGATTVGGTDAAATTLAPTTAAPATAAPVTEPPTTAAPPPPATWPDNMVTLPTAPKATITIDGVKDDGYGAAYQETKTRNDTPGATGTLYSAWDDKNIYYYLEVKDTTPNHEATNVYERDCVEFFINWNSTPDEDSSDSSHPYWQIRIASAPSADDGVQISCGGNSGLVADNNAGDVGIPFKIAPLVAGDTDLKQGYIIEVAMPIALAPGATPLKEGGSVVVDFQIADNQDGSTRGSQAFLVPDDDMVDNQWQWPNACRGILPLGGVKTVAMVAATKYYPDSSITEGIAAPKDGVLLTGQVIGSVDGGWGDPPNPDTGAGAAFDGDTTTFFDPLAASDPTTYTGLKTDKPYVLTEIRICPRATFLDRFNGASIYGFNDDVFDPATATQIWVSDAAADDAVFQCITADKFIAGTNTGFTHYAYFNLVSHGDVAEIELYGNPK